MSKSNNVYMMVTNDEYELPLIVADTLDELAEKAGKKKTTISMCLYKYNAGKTSRCMYRRVEVEE